MRTRVGVISTALPLAVIVLASGCSSSSAADGSATSGDSGTITAIGAENEYASVIGQVGGKYVHAVAIVSNPDTDPHTFEASPSVAREISQARLIVQNGAGYDDWITGIQRAAPDPGRKVINVQQLLGLPKTVANPHLWYKPATMPAVASAIAGDLAAIQPAHASYFTANAARFTASLAPWNQALAQFKTRYPDTPVATTEPVADYMLQAAGTNNMTPWAFQAFHADGTQQSMTVTERRYSAVADRRLCALAPRQYHVAWAMGWIRRFAARAVRCGARSGQALSGDRGRSRRCWHPRRRWPSGSRTA